MLRLWSSSERLICTKFTSCDQGECHYFYYKTSTEVSKFINFEHNLSFYAEMAAIMHIKILQPVRNNENNIVTSLSG